MKNKSTIFVLLAFCITVSAHAIQIIPANPRPSSSEKLGKALGEGLNEAAKQLAQRKKNQQEQEERRIEQERYYRNLERERNIINTILNNYNSTKHSECILEILKSDVSADSKKMIIDALNEQYRTVTNHSSDIH